MEKEKMQGVIEAILFSAGRVVKIRELMTILEETSDNIIQTINEMQEEYKKQNRGIELVRVEDGYQLSSKKDYYEYLYPLLGARSKPTISQASLEVLSIIAYNPRATKSDIDAIRGVDSQASLYRLLEYNFIEQAGKADLPGKPMTYKVTEKKKKTFGLKSIKDLPKLPKYKLDSNRQIVIDEIEENTDKQEETEEKNKDFNKNEMPILENNNENEDNKIGGENNE